jgi:hypothetical protein
MSDDYNPQLLASNPRATLAEWQRFQPIIAEAFRRHPEPYVFQPQELTCATFVSRARDAIRGAIAFNYQITFTTPERLRTWRSEVIFKYDRTTVYIGPPTRCREALTVAAVSSPVQNGYHFSSLSPDELAAFALLLSTSRLQGPVVVTKPTSLAVPAFPNLETIRRPDGSLVLL